MQIDFEALFASSPNPYVLLDRSLTLVWMNEAYLRTTMRERGELVGKTMFEAFPSDPRSESHRLLEGSFRHVLSTGEVDELALIRYDIPRPDGSLEVRYWSATHTPLKDGRGDVLYILQHTVDVTELHGLRTLRDEMGIVQRANAVQARNLDLLEESHRFKKLVEQAPGFVAIMSGPEHRFEMANQAFQRLVGHRTLTGRNIADALPEVAEQGFVALLDEVRGSGRPYVGRRAKVMLDNEGLGSVEERFLDFVCQPILADDGTVSGIFVQGHDVTDEVEAEERQKLLINELNHRVKNTLAIVQGLAMQSFRHVKEAEPAQRAFDARLNALASAHNLLTTRNWEEADLVDTVTNAVQATVGAEAGRVDVQGPDFPLPPQAAVSLAMIVHELCTNAIKYGALSRETGRIDVEWSFAEKETGCLLTFLWTERGGPPVSQPEQQGFGTRLIQRGISNDRSGKVTMEFKPDGMRCTLTALLPKGRP